MELFRSSVKFIGCHGIMHSEGRFECLLWEAVCGVGMLGKCVGSLIVHSEGSPMMTEEG